MREVSFKLEAGKEIPERLDGTEIRYTLPTTIDEIRSICGGNDDVVVSVFNEGYNLNHRQKIAKRFAARENSTIDTINAGVAGHVPGVRAVGDGTPKVASVRKQMDKDMLAMLQAADAANGTDLAAKYAERLAAIAPKPKVAKPAPTVDPVTNIVEPTAKAAVDPKAAHHKR